MKIKTLLIDDEKKSLDILSDMIQESYEHLQIVGKTQIPEEGLKLIHRLKPELVFLDIAMPKMNGFELLRQIPDPAFEIIFVTAFDEFAIEAIKHCAIGYLLKPVDDKELEHAITNAIQNIELKTAQEKNLTLIENLVHNEYQNKKLAISTNKGVTFIRIRDIIHCEGIEGYSKLYLEGHEEIMSSYNVGYYGKRLKGYNFYLVHKSHLINLDHMELYGKDGNLVLSNEQIVTVAKNKRAAFSEYLKSNF